MKYKIYWKEMLKLWKKKNQITNEKKKLLEKQNIFLKKTITYLTNDKKENAYNRYAQNKKTFVKI